MTAVLDSDGRPLREGSLVRMGSHLARVVSLPRLVESDLYEFGGPAGYVVVRPPGADSGVQLPVFAREGYAYCPDLTSGSAAR